MQQIDRRKPMQKCDFKKVALHSAWVFSFQFAEYFQNTFSQEHIWMAASEIKTFWGWEPSNNKNIEPDQWLL